MWSGRWLPGCGCRYDLLLLLLLLLPIRQRIECRGCGGSLLLLLLLLMLLLMLYLLLCNCYWIDNVSHSSSWLLLCCGWRRRSIHNRLNGNDIGILQNKTIKKAEQ
jgi:hypothetical protein